MKSKLDASVLAFFLHAVGLLVIVIAVWLSEGDYEQLSVESGVTKDLLRLQYSLRFWSSVLVGIGLNACGFLAAIAYRPR